MKTCQTGALNTQIVSPSHRSTTMLICVDVVPSWYLAAAIGHLLAQPPVAW